MKKFLPKFDNFNNKIKHNDYSKLFINRNMLPPLFTTKYEVALTYNKKSQFILKFTLHRLPRRHRASCVFFLPNKLIYDSQDVSMKPVRSSYFSKNVHHFESFLQQKLVWQYRKTMTSRLKRSISVASIVYANWIRRTWCRFFLFYLIYTV